MINSVYFLLCLLLMFSTSSGLCLDGTSEQLISGSRYRVPDQFFQADSHLHRYTPQQARLVGYSWCSSHERTSHWLQVTFGMDVNISIIQTGRLDRFYYMTKFEVHVGNGTEGSLHPISDNSTQPIVFMRTGTYDVENTTLPSPVITQVLRIVPLEWSPSNFVVCLKLEAIGCPFFQESCLDGTTERLISGSRYRVQDQFFEAESMEGIYTPENARLGGESSWCFSKSPSASIEPHWLQVTFGMDVNISIIQTDSIFTNYYVTSFEVHVGDGTEGSLHPLTISDNSTQPMVFVRTMKKYIENTMLPSSVTTRVLRIVLVESTPDAFVCLRLEAFGCITSHVCEAERLLTDDEELLDSVIGSLSITSASAYGYNIKNLVSTSNTTWCTNGDLGSDSYLQLNFTSMVSLTYMKAKGQVSQFRLEVQDESGNFNAYGITSESTNFTASGPGLELFTFWRPIQGSTFRFFILNFIRFSGNMCWNIELYGCIINTGLTPPTVPVTETEPEASFYTTQEMKQGSLQGQFRYAILGGAVGGGLCLMALLLLILMVTAIFIFTRRRAHIKLPESNEDSAGHKFDNSIYGQQMPSSSPYGDTSEHNFDNSIYGIDVNTGNHPARPEIASSIVSNTYESLPNTTTEFHEPTHDPNGTVDHHNAIEAYDNPIYA